MIKMKIAPRLAEVGKIKIGMKGDERQSQGGKKYRQPVKLDHFIVTTTERGSDGNFGIDTHVMEALGESPTEIPIRLLFDDIDMNFHTSYQYYVGSKCICRGDGETAQRTGKDEITKDIDCDPETCEFNKSKKCKVGGILSCIIPCSADIGGVYRFRTHGWNSVSSILAALMFFRDNTNGVLQGLPLKLKFMKKTTEEHGNVPMVTVVLDAVQLNEFRQLAVTESKNRLQLGVNMLQIEDSAREAGFTDVSGIDIEDAYELPPEKGTSADELGDRLKFKQEETLEPEKPEDAEIVEEEPEPAKKGESVI